MIGDQDAHAALAQAGDQLLQVGHRDRIHSGKRLIEQQIAGPLLPHSQGAGHFTAPALATGELLTLTVLEGREVEFLHQGIQPPPALLAGDPTLFQGEFQVLANSELAEHTGLLGEVADPQARPLGHGQHLDAASIQQYPALVGAEQTSDQAKGGGLPGPVRSEQTHHLPWVELDGDVVHEHPAAKGQKHIVEHQAHGVGRSGLSVVSGAIGKLLSTCWPLVGSAISRCWSTR